MQTHARSLDRPTIAHVRSLAQVFSRKCRVCDLEDMEQELLCYLWEELPKFCAAKQEWRHFVYLTCRQRWQQLLRRHKHQQQYLAGGLVPLEEPIDEEGLTLAETLIDPNTPPVHGQGLSQLETVCFVRQVVKTLPPKLKILAELLMDHSPCRARELLGLPDATMHRRMARLRAEIQKKYNEVCSANSAGPNPNRTNVASGRHL